MGSKMAMKISRRAASNPWCFTQGISLLRSLEIASLNIDNKTISKGIMEPFLIRREVLERAMQGRDMIGRARTGTGKTLSFEIPILNRMIQHNSKNGVLCNGLYRSSPHQAWTRSFASDSSDLVEAVVPHMGESITDGTLATFLKKPGDSVEADEAIAQIETDKVTVDVTSPHAGYIEKFVAKEGDTVVPGTKVAIISKSHDGAKPASTEKEKLSPEPSQPSVAKDEKVSDKVKPPSAQPLEGVSKDKVATPESPSTKASPSEPQLPPKDRERRVPMTRLRKRVATRLKDSQNTFALLTTFNEVDMTNLMQLRTEYKDAFQEKHGVKLGFMSGFIKAAVSALQQIPTVNAVIDGDDIIYRDYIDISIAVGTPKGLVVPVIRNVDKMNFAEIEKTMGALAKKANSGSISIDEMAGGTFTISNGGVYGSLLSTPIINPPQSAILGMHSIQNRPVCIGANIVPRPMMYIALTYDHRLIDGREAVYFLRRIKDVVEDPRRLLLDV